MNLLFLDTETNSLSPREGYIIELAGAIFELDENTLKINKIDEFESLIHLEGTFDSKITRLTGIEEHDLAIAPNTKYVKSKWIEFLDKHKINAVIGHSIDFDIGFLRVGGYYIPEANIIDTLELSKYFMSSLEAVNLEYLEHYYKLDEKLDKDTLARLKPHRALYDTLICAELYEVILDKYSKQNTPKEVAKFIDKRLTFKVNTLRQYEPKEYVNQIATNILSWDGSIKHISLKNRINNILLDNSSINKLINLMEECNSVEAKRIITITYGIFDDIINGAQKVKVHLFGSEEFIFFYSILSWLEDTQNVKNKNKLEELELLTKSINNLSKDSIDLNNIQGYIESLNFFAHTSLERTKIQSSIDFARVTATQIAFRGLVKVNINTSNNDHFDLIGKISALTKLKLESSLFSAAEGSFIQYIENKLDQELSKLNKLAIIANYEVLVTSRSFKISYDIDFDLNDYVNSFLVQNKIKEIATYLSKANQEYLTSLLKITLPESLKIKAITNAKINVRLDDIKDYLDELGDKSISMFAGNNKILMKLSEYIIKNFDSDDYLIYGEGGGATKIVSKIVRNKYKIVLVRHRDFYSIIHSVADFDEYCSIGYPYLAVPDYLLNQWGGKFNELLNGLGMIDLESKSGKLFDAKKKEITMIKSNF